MRKTCLLVTLLPMLLFVSLVGKSQAYVYETDISIFSTAVGALSYGMQNSLFYSEGYWWIFYWDSIDSRYLYRTYNEITHIVSSALLVRADCYDPGAMDIRMENETFFHYALYQGEASLNLYYRMGQFNPDGIITWVAAEQTAIGASADIWYENPTIAIDSNGYPWISYFHIVPPSVCTTAVVKSSTKNGIWTTQAGFPIDISSVADCEQRVYPVTLPDGRMLFLYCVEEGASLAREWNGASWDDEQTVGSDSSRFTSRGILKDDIVHAWHLDPGYATGYGLYWQLVYSTYNITSKVWTTVETLNPFGTSVYNLADHTATFDDDNGDIYLTYIQKTLGGSPTYYAHILRKFSVGQWTSTNLSNTTTYATFVKGNGYKSYDSRLGFLLCYSEHCWLRIISHNFVFHGVFDETSGLYIPEGADVTAHFTDATLPANFEVNGTYNFVSLKALSHFSIVFGTTNHTREYWVGETEYIGDIYLFDDELEIYVISFHDLAGVLKPRPFVYAQYNINGTLMTVEKRRVDVEPKVQMGLVEGRKYYLKIINGESYTFGELLTTSTKTIALTLRGVDFPKETLLIYTYVRIYGTRTFSNPTGSISIIYDDTLEETESVSIFINYKNGTNAYNASEYDSTFVHTWNNAQNNTDYRVVVTIQHGKFGTIPWKQYFPSSLSPTSPLDLSFLGSLPFDTSIIIPCVLILFAMGCFSVLNAYVGAFAGVITAAILTYMGWIPIPASALMSAFVVCICMGIIYAKKRVQYE